MYTWIGAGEHERCSRAGPRHASWAYLVLGVQASVHGVVHVVSMLMRNQVVLMMCCMEATAGLDLLSYHLQYLHGSVIYRLPAGG